MAKEKSVMRAERSVASAQTVRNGSELAGKMKTFPTMAAHLGFSPGLFSSYFFSMFNFPVADERGKLKEAKKNLAKIQ